MNDLMKDATGVVMAIVGVAILYVLVSPNNQTARVIGGTLAGTGNLLSVAMGGTPTAVTVAGG